MHVKKSELVCIQLVWILLTINHYVSSRWSRTRTLARCLKSVSSFPILIICASDCLDDWLLNKTKPGPYLLCSTHASVAFENNMVPLLSVSPHLCIFWILYNVNWAWKRWKRRIHQFSMKSGLMKEKRLTLKPLFHFLSELKLPQFGHHTFFESSRHKQHISKIRWHISPLFSREYWGSRDCMKEGSEGGKGQTGGEN